MLLSLHWVTDTPLQEQVCAIFFFWRIKLLALLLNAYISKELLKNREYILSLIPRIEYFHLWTSKIHCVYLKEQTRWLCLLPLNKFQMCLYQKSWRFQRTLEYLKDFLSKVETMPSFRSVEVTRKSYAHFIDIYLCRY